MDDLTDYTSPAVGFDGAASRGPSDQPGKYVDSSVATAPLPSTQDAHVGTEPPEHRATQTERTPLPAGHMAPVDDAKLASWLRRIYPQVEEELQRGITPLPDEDGGGVGGTDVEHLTIQRYQKISVPGVAENSKGLATWLAVHTNNAPALVVTHVPPHDDWCTHVEQQLRLYVPQRLAAGGNFVVFTEAKSVPLKACLATLVTNPYNKNTFAGSTVDGDIYVWQLQPGASAHSPPDVAEVCSVTSAYGCAAALDWCSETRLLTAHTNGLVRQWLLGKSMLVEAEFALENATAHEITSLVSLSADEFMVGSKGGGVFRCTKLSMAGGLRKPTKTVELKRHLFAVSSLLRTKTERGLTVVSCDLSGQVYFHDVDRDDSGGEPREMLQIALPFKNAIGCMTNATTLYCPGLGGALDCIRVRDGVVTTIKGSLSGKGNFIKISDNGCWLIIGLYNNEFQIFYVEH